MADITPSGSCSQNTRSYSSISLNKMQSFTRDPNEKCAIRIVQSARKIGTYRYHPLPTHGRDRRYITGDETFGTKPPLRVYVYQSPSEVSHGRVGGPTEHVNVSLEAKWSRLFPFLCLFLLYSTSNQSGLWNRHRRCCPWVT